MDRREIRDMVIRTINAYMWRCYYQRPGTDIEEFIACNGWLIECLRDLQTNNLYNEEVWNRIRTATRIIVSRDPYDCEPLHNWIIEAI